MLKLLVKEFDEFVNQPENADRVFEFIAGEIVEVPSNPYVSKLALRISHLIANYLDIHDLGHLTGEAGGYMVSGERYAPDVAFLSKAKQPELAQQGYNPIPPELAIEIDFPSTSQTKDNLRFKIANYLAAGTIVWVVFPETETVEVYTPSQPAKILGLDGILECPSVLPDFKLAVKDIFKK